MLTLFSDPNKKSNLFELLPKDLLNYLFSMLDSPKDFLNIPLVCKKWKEILEQHPLLHFFGVTSIKELNSLWKSNKKHAAILCEKKDMPIGINLYVLGLNASDPCYTTVIPVSCPLNVRNVEIKMEMFLFGNKKVNGYSLSAWHLPQSNAEHDINQFLIANEKCEGSIIALAHVKTKEEVAYYQAAIKQSMLLFCFTEMAPLSQMFANTILIDSQCDFSEFYQRVMMRVEKINNFAQEQENKNEWRCSIL